MSADLPQHKLSLATELLDDIELLRGSVSALVLKGARLARLVEDDAVTSWLQMEMHGYYDNDLGRRYMTATGRWIDRDANKGYWQSVSQIEAQIAAQEALLTSLRLPDLSGEMILPTIRDIRQHQATTANALAMLGGVRSKVLALLHDFATTWYYELGFSKHQAEVFDDVRQRIDTLLAPLMGDALAKIDSIYRRLGEGDPEAVSQALTTCRRLIDAVADAIYPPRAEALEVAGQMVKLGPQQTQNRLNAYTRDRTASDSRRAKLRRTLADLYERVSAGVHKEVPPDEARFLFLSTYLYLGEILSLDSTTLP